jgi:hypothetical protein
MRSLHWFSEHTVAALTLAGLFVYGGTLLVYAQFYGRFGIEPEEAGVGYTTTLARAAPAFLSWLVEWAGVAFVVALMLWLVRWIARRDVVTRAWIARGDVVTRARAVRRKEAQKKAQERGAPAEEQVGPRRNRLSGPGLVLDKTRRRQTKVTRADLIVIGLVCAVGLLVGLFLFAAGEQSNRLATRVLNGEQIRPTSLFTDMRWPPSKNDFWANPLRIRVERVCVLPAQPGQDLPASVPQGRTLAYLGRGGNTIVLYDSGTGRTLHVPEAQVVLSTPWRRSGCRAQVSAPRLGQPGKRT